MSGNARQRRVKRRAEMRSLPPVYRGVASLWELAERLPEPESGVLLGPAVVPLSHRSSVVPMSTSQTAHSLRYLEVSRPTEARYIVETA